MMLTFKLFSQKLAEGKYWVNLADKTGNGYSLSTPEEFLSQRSLQRRVKQNIDLTHEDLPVSRLYIDSLQTLGVTIHGTSKWFNAVIIESFDTLLLDTLDHFSFIAGFDYKTYSKKSVKGSFKQGKTIENDPGIQSPGYDYGLSLPQIEFLKGNSLHELGYKGDGMQIAVIDGGFFSADTIAAFDSLWNDNRVLSIRDFSNSGTDFFNTASHGMSVLSTMAANLPGEIIGTAPKASYYLLKSEIVQSETRLEEALWILAAEYADSAGADIITSSLGYSEFDDTTQNYSYEDMDGKTTLVTRGAEKAFSKGMVVVSSAGNSGNKKWKYITSPADGTNILAIGAADTTGRLAAFSSRGPSYDGRVKPDIIAVGYKTEVVNSSGKVSQGYGTSFSGPQVAGLVACLWEAAPEKTNQEIIQAVRRSSDHYFHPDNDVGYGIPDFMTALYLLKMKTPDIPSGKLSVIPNPNPGIFDIRTESIQEGKLNISIYSQLGKKIYSGVKEFNAGFTRINELEGKMAGIYFIVAESEGKKYLASVVKL